MTSDQPTENGKKAIIIAGYYRSGTSALSGALSDLGIAIHGDAEANEHNPKGFFESTDLIRFDIRMFDALEMPWADIGHTQPEWINRPDMRLFAAQIGEILGKKFGDHDTVAVKHPHICRLLPIYARAAECLGYSPVVLHTHRNPYEIATSQAKKNGLTRAHALLLWASYITEAEKHARALPRTWVFYQDLLVDPTATVFNALGHLGIRPPKPASVRFVTKTLRRSAEADAADLHPAVADLVHRISGAIEAYNFDQAEWNGFSAEVATMAAFLREMGRSSNRSARGVGELVRAVQDVAAQQTVGGGAATHQVRPAERGDEAERTRLAKFIKAEGLADGAPVTVMVVVQPDVPNERVVETVNSLRNGWLAPVTICIFAVSQAADSGYGLGVFERFFPTAEAMESALYPAMSEAATSYVAAIAAGDMVEPDAIVRLALTTKSDAAMIYTDEIVTGGDTAVIRAKPAMDINRLRESCFIGDWVWYSTELLRSLGGFDHGLPGAEEYDMQLRIAESGAAIVRLPEAVFVRGQNTRRDATPIETSMKSAIQAIDAHLARCGVPATASQSNIGIPGLFTLVYNTTTAQRDLPLAIMLQVDGRTMRQVLDTTNRMVPKLGTRDILVFTAPEAGEIDPAVAQFLASAENTVAHESASIRIRRPSGALGAQIQAVRNEFPGHAVLVCDPAGRPEHDDVSAILLAMLHSIHDAAVLGARTFWTEDNGTTLLLGPVLFGAPRRIGANRDGRNPGPGGWLAATHVVDSVDGPLVIVHPDAPPMQSSAESWAEISASIAMTTAPVARKRTLWTPDVSVEIPKPRSDETDKETKVAITLPYRQESHHPAMSMIGDPLFLEGRYGLVDAEGSILLSAAGRFEDGRIIDMVRNARLDASVCAAFSPDPVDYASAGRAIAQGRQWFRVNPRYTLALPNEKPRFPFEAVWTELPSVEIKALVQEAVCNHATSQGIANGLKSFGARKVNVVLPKLRKSIWDGNAGPRTTLPTKPTVMWIDEGMNIAWLGSVIADTKDTVDWVVIGTTELPLPGYVAQARPGILEEHWRDIFQKFMPRILIRPTPGTTWRDDYVLLMGVAAGCAIIAGRESPGRDGLPIAGYVGSNGPDRWRAAIERHASVPGSVYSDIAKLDIWFGENDYDWLIKTPNRTLRKVA